MSELIHDTTQTAVEGKGFLIQCNGDRRGVVLDIQASPADTDGIVRRHHAYVRISADEAEHLLELIKRAIRYSDVATVDQPSLSLVAA